MIRRTLKDYTSNLNDAITGHLDLYEDNSLKSFFKFELEKYNYYKSVLIQIKNIVYPYFEHESIPIEFESKPLFPLMLINSDIYNHIITDHSPPIYLTDQEGNNDNIPEEPSNNDTSEVDFLRLSNAITSSNLVIDFITDQLNKINNNPNLSFNSAPSYQGFPSSDNNGFDLIQSTVNDSLSDLINNIDDENFNRLSNALTFYFKNKHFPKLDTPIKFESVNKKKIGWILKETYNTFKSEKLSYEYLKFAHDNINIFKKVQISKVDLTQSNLYKYFTTRP